MEGKPTNIWRTERMRMEGKQTIAWVRKTPKGISIWVPDECISSKPDEVTEDVVDQKKEV